MQVVEVADLNDGDACGYVQDLSLDLQVGVIKPWLLLGEHLEDFKQHNDCCIVYGCI